MGNGAIVERSRLTCKSASFAVYLVNPAEVPPLHQNLSPGRGGGPCLILQSAVQESVTLELVSRVAASSIHLLK